MIESLPGWMVFIIAMVVVTLLLSGGRDKVRRVVAFIRWRLCRPMPRFDDENRWRQELVAWQKRRPR